MRKTICLLLIAAIFTSFVSFAEGDEAIVSSIKNTDENNAYIIFGKEIKTNMMHYEDGLAQGIANKDDPLYSEEVNFNGLDGRKVYNTNYVYMSLDKSFYEIGDSKFLVSITYYDFGPDVGYFHLEYNSSDENLGDGKANKRISLMKTGITPRWYTVKVYIEDAEFSGAMPFGSDLRLVSNAYNAFAKVEVTNISAAERNPDIKIGTVNSSKAEALYQLGLYDGISETEFNPGLEQEITRQELIKLILKASGYENDALSKRLQCEYTDVSAEYAPYVAYARSVLKIINGDTDGKFNAEDKATKRELLTFYLRLLGYNGADTYEKAEELAKEYVIIEGNDLIFNIDRPATRDNFVGAALNSLTAETNGSRKKLMHTMLANQVLTVEQIKATGTPALVAQVYNEPVKYPKKEIVDSLTGRTIYYMNVDGGKAIRPYVTQQHWTHDGRSFIVGSDKTGTFYEYNIEEETLRSLDTGAAAGGSADAMVTPDDIVFYRGNNNQYFKMDLNTYEKTKVADPPLGGNGMSVLQVTNDGKYLTCYYREQSSPDDYVGAYNRVRIIPRLDCTTGEWDTTTLTHIFDNPAFPDVGHPIINPVYENLLFFCHEGTTTEIPDRLWIGDMNTGETRNLFLQAEREDGRTGETSGHEVWSQDGEKMYFVKYTYATNVGQSGLVRIDKDGSNREYLNGDYKFWHCYPSADHKWVVGDTQIGGGRSEIVLVNTETYESHLLANIPLSPTNHAHPYQPHPIISPCGTKVSWQMIDETGMLGCAWMDISDIVNGYKSEVENINFTDDASIYTIKNSSSEVKKTDYMGEECYKIPQYNEMCIDLNDETVLDENTSITLELTYCDIGHQPMLINYTTAVKSAKDLANRENSSVKIPRENTGKWKTMEISIPEVNLHNAGKHRTDIKISGMYSEAYVKDLKIKTADNEAKYHK